MARVGRGRTAANRLAGAPICEGREDGYTFGMKTAISLPEDIFKKADRLALRLRKSRSELYREAVAEYVARHDVDSITEAMNRVADSLDTRSDDFVSAAVQNTLGHSEW